LAFRSISEDKIQIQAVGTDELGDFRAIAPTLADSSVTEAKTWCEIHEYNRVS
jgi:hypothetical protein